MLAFAGIILFAFSLRSAVASLSPVIAQIEQDFPVSTVAIGLIGTTPPVCYAIFGIITPALERRLGLERLASAAMIVVTIGLIVRALAPNSVVLVGATAAIFAAVGVGNILLPPLVKKYFPDRLGLMMSLYSTTMAVATFFPPLVAVPLGDGVGWRVSLGLWAVFAVAAFLPWLALLRRERAVAAAGVQAPSPRVFGRMWRTPMAWAVLGGFTVSSIFAYTSFAWLPEILTDIAGVSPAQAGGLLSLFAAIGLPAALLIPLLVVRFHAVRAIVAAAVVGGFIGIAGLTFAPTVATWLWVAFWGFPTFLFPMSLVLLGVRSRTSEGAVALSGFVQSVGYAIAAIFPLAFGVVHEVTGSWNIAFGVLSVILLAAIPAGLIASRSENVEDAWERRRGQW